MSRMQMNRRHLLASAAAVGLVSVASAAGTEYLSPQIKPVEFARHRNHKHSPSLPVNITLNNLDPSNSYSTPYVSYGHAFAQGDVSTSHTVAVYDDSGTRLATQVDAVSRWPDGSIRFAVLSHKCTGTFAAGASKTYAIKTKANVAFGGTLPGWGSNPAATLAANTNFQVEYSGFDAQTRTYTVSLNNIFGNYTQWPWGTSNPTGGWEYTKYGTTCLEFHGWQYIINDSTSNPQGYVRCDIWVKAWSATGPFEIDVRTSQPNMWNAINSSSEQWNNNPGRWATLLTVKNGSTVVFYGGGPNDYRTTTIANSNFNTSTYAITAPFNTLFPQQGIVFSSTGSLPAGLSVGTIYWLAYRGSDNPYIMAERVHAAQVEEGNAGQWQPNASYVSAYGGSYCFNNGIIYVCVSGGTSASSGGPTGTGVNIVDGSCLWDSVSLPFTSQGSGTITAYPVNACFPSTAWMTGDAYGNPIWVGSGNRAPIFPGHDFTYLTTKSKFVPCYNINAGYQTTGQSTNVYAPNENYGGLLWYQATTGDGAGDQRIGYIDGWGVTALFNPTDPFYTYASIQAALCYNNALFSYMNDERNGQPFVGNNGPGNSGSPYTNFPSLHPGWSAGQSPTFGVGNWLPWSPNYQDQSGYGGQYYVDSSHTPASWQIPYLKTGRPCFLEQGIHLGNVDCFMQYGNYSTIGSTTYYCVPSATPAIQERAWAWALRSLCQAAFVIPSNNPFYPVLLDYYDTNAAFFGTYYTSVIDANAAALGLLNVLDAGGTSNGHIAPWQQFFVYLVLAMESWRGGLSNTAQGTNWNVLMAYSDNFWAMYAASLPGSLYYIGLYQFIYSPYSQDLHHAYQTASDAFGATAAYGVGYQPSLLAPWLGSTALYDANSDSVHYYELYDNFPENCTWYGAIGRAALTMFCVAQPTNTALSSLLATLDTEISSATGLSTVQGGIQWYGTYSSAMQNFHTFAIF